VRELIGKCLVMAGLVLLSGVAALALIPPDRDDYLAIIGPKMERLRATVAPRVIFVGGSNLAFGVDSPAVEEALGYPVVNMGLGFNMGLRFMLDMIEPEVRSGDLVVLVPEYNLFFGLLDGDERLLDVLELYPEGLRHIRSPWQMLNLARYLPRHVQFKVTRVLSTLGRTPAADCIYCPRAFNAHGDLVAHQDRPSKDVSKMDFLRNAGRDPDPEAIAVINAFAVRLEQRGARVVLLFPSIPQPHYAQRQESIDRLYARLRQDLRIEVPASPADYTYPVAYFYDWVYHLNREGRALRTARIVADLREVIEAGRSRGSDPAYAKAAPGRDLLSARTIDGGETR
jgi:hypothetical protein